MDQNVSLNKPIGFFKCTHQCRNLIWAWLKVLIYNVNIHKCWLTPNIISWAPKSNKIFGRKIKMLAHVYSSWIEKQISCYTQKPLLVSLCLINGELGYKVGWLDHYNLSWKRNIHLKMYHFLRLYFLQISCR